MACVTLNHWPKSPESRARSGVVLGLALLVLIAYALPFLGLLFSLVLPLATHRYRRHLWPEASNASSLAWSLLAWAGLWLPGLVDFVTPVFDAAGIEVSTTWLILPLCAPSDSGAVLIPALAAAVVCLVGLLGTLTTRNGWAWVAGAWIAPWVHSLVFSQLSHDFLC